MTEEEIALLDLIEHPVFVLEPDATGIPRYAAFNAIARVKLGKPLSEIVGKSAAELYPGRMGRVALERHLAVVKSGKRKIHEIILPVEDGERMIRTVLNPVLDEAGHVARIVATSTDETDKYTLRNSRARWEAATQDMEQFVNIAAHDLRAPMRHVATLASMMREDFQDLDEERLELIDLLEDVSSKTLRLIGDILTHAQAGEVHATRSRFTLDALIEEIRALVDPFGQADLTVASGMIEADQTAMQIVLRNLIDNALKYGLAKDVGGHGLRVDIDVAQSDPGQIEVRFRDNGPGFNEKSLLRLNDEEFTQEGGYGLIAIRRLLKRYEGEILIGNRKDGTGAEILFRLPGAWQAESAQRAGAAQQASG